MNKPNKNKHTDKESKIGCQRGVERKVALKKCCTEGKSACTLALSGSQSAYRFGCATARGSYRLGE